MLKAELVNVLVTKRGLTVRQAELAVDQIFDAMKAELVKGESIELRGFGAFHVKDYGGYTGRNPKTKVVIEVRAKRAVVFRTGKELRERLNRRPLTDEELEPAAESPDDTQAEENAA